VVHRTRPAAALTQQNCIGGNVANPTDATVLKVKLSGHGRAGVLSGHGADPSQCLFLTLSEHPPVLTRCFLSLNSIFVLTVTSLKVQTLSNNSESEITAQNLRISGQKAGASTPLNEV
jgi:hypothetical protein